MKRNILFSAVALCFALSLACSRGEIYPIRWVYLNSGLENDEELGGCSSLSRGEFSQGYSEGLGNRRLQWL